MSTIIDTLITDRTQADVDRWNTLRLKNYLTEMTSAEQTEWSSDSRGSYNISDLNRVGEAVAYLSNRLTVELGFNLSVVAKQNWIISDIPTATQLTDYLTDVQKIRSVLVLSTDTPLTPTDMNNLTYQEANDIEEILISVENIIKKILNQINLGWAIGIADIGLYGGLT